MTGNTGTGTGSTDCGIPQRREREWEPEPEADLTDADFESAFASSSMVSSSSRRSSTGTLRPAVSEADLHPSTAVIAATAVEAGAAAGVEAGASVGAATDLMLSDHENEHEQELQSLRPRFRRRRTARQYYTPPSRHRSPVRDSHLSVETAPQDPDIFADPDTDYFSSVEPSSSARKDFAESLAQRLRFFDASARPLTSA